MDPFHFTCPHCSTRLRVKDPRSIGRDARCPDCRGAIVIVDTRGVWRVEASTNTAPPLIAGRANANRHETGAPAAEPDRSTAGRATRADGSRRAGWWMRPAGLIGIVAMASVLGLGSYAVFRREPIAETALTTVRHAADESDAAPANPAAPRATAEEAGDDVRFATINRLSHEILTEDEAFPPGTQSARGLPAEKRLSWLAILADRMDSSRPIAWDRPWTDPLNDSFVRRRILDFQNSAIEILTSPDGYPATHYVGIAGIGADAAHLDVTHPRAGVFGYNRRTRPADIAKGLSQTFLVLGVQSQLGSWAAGGPATVRGVTREPYVNGPDGFGTGQPDSMLALMADGSVRTVSSTIEPEVFRRLAVIAGDAAYSEDAGLAPQLSQVERGFEIGTNDEAPLVPEFAAEHAAAVRAIDIEVSLGQPIERYELDRPRPVAELLPGLAEMVGAPIRWDGDEKRISTRLASSVQVDLKHTTVGGILEALLSPAGLTYRVHNGQLQLLPQE